MWRLALITVAISLSGCLFVPIPVVEPEPYSEHALSKIKQGGNYRQNVVELLGEPDVVREDDAIWIYGKSRHLSYVIGIIGYGADASFWVEDFQFIVIEFERDTIRHFELVEDRAGCTSTGICLPHAWSIGQGGRILQTLTPDLTVVASIRDDDKIAKEFQIITDKCSVYVYREKLLGRVAISSTRNVLITPDTYLYFPLRPGPHKIVIRGWKGEVLEKVIDCDMGKLIFVRLHFKRGWTKNRYAIDIADEKIGKKAIGERNLIIVP